MSNHGLELRAAVQAAAAGGGAYLAAAQRADGFWSDYDLPPGKSEAWTTACAGCALLQNRFTREAHLASIESAVAALKAAERADGWGYNRATACDADSSAWSVLFLSQAGACVSGSSVLERYLSRIGAVRTFSSRARFGSWATEHDEVAPLVGLALLAAGEQEWAERIRQRIVDRWHQSRGWEPFWWTSRTYVAAQSLEYLSARGAIPRDIAEAERSLLRKAAVPLDTFGTSQQLMAGVHLELHLRSDRLVHALLERQGSDGGWESSPTLRVPQQSNPDRGGVFADQDRILGTSLAMVALARWQTEHNSETRSAVESRS